jgi:hypothetical protein
MIYPALAALFAGTAFKVKRNGGPLLKSVAIDKHSQVHIFFRGPRRTIGSLSWECWLVLAIDRQGPTG